MKKVWVCILVACTALSLWITPGYAESAKSIVVATGKSVPTDDFLSEDYRFPEKYRENAVQFVTQDGVLLCGYVLGKGTCGVTLGHANGWMVKSWLPFAERLVDAGYQVILWEFRNNKPSGSAKSGADNRWDLDVLAAAQVLRERGATEIVSMGASDGGTATAAAAPYIPGLVGLGILSSPSIGTDTGGKGKALEAVAKISVPAFFAVSKNDFAGNLYPHVKALYEVCSSTQKQFHVIDGPDHGTDMITPDVPGKGYAALPQNDAQKQKRKDLADKLMFFVKKVFEKGADKTGESNAKTSKFASDTGAGKTNAASSQHKTGESADRTENSNGNTAMYPIAAGVGVLLILIAAISIQYRRTRE